MTKSEIATALSIDEPVLDAILAAGVRGVSMKQTLVGIEQAKAKSNGIIQGLQSQIDPLMAPVNARKAEHAAELATMMQPVNAILAQINAKLADHAAKVSELEAAYSDLDNFVTVDPPNIQAILDAIA